MRVYETMIILDPELEEGEVKDFTDERVIAVLEQQGANIRDVDHWGKRSLAYEIRHKKEGHFVVITADAEPAACGELSRKLALADSVFRHKTVRRTDLESAALGEE